MLVRPAKQRAFITNFRSKLFLVLRNSGTRLKFVAETLKTFHRVA